MHVKDKYVRTVKHSVLQDGHKLIIKYIQRSYVCTGCKNRYTPDVAFIRKHKQISNTTELSAVKRLSHITLPVTLVASDFNISDTQLHNDFLRRVDMKRLPLPKYLSIDEVHTNFRKDCKYALVLMNFETHEIIDLIPSRREEYTSSYFLNIPKEERDNVEVIISDMYEPYLQYVNRYFHRAEAVVDSFHVIQWILDRIRSYINSQVRKYKDDTGSDEYYLLKKCSWLILKNEENIKDITNPTKINQHFRYLITTEELRRKLYHVDPLLESLFELKEEYIEFNNRQRATVEHIPEELEQLINEYKDSDIEIFKEFAKVLKNKKEYIVKSFTVIPALGKSVRLSNGPMESFNRKPKDLIRIARGVENFEFFKQRILFSERLGYDLLEEPRPLKEIQNKTDKKRGTYNKKKK